MSEFGARAKAAWARLIRKVYEADPLECPKCKAPMRVIALKDTALVKGSHGRLTDDPGHGPLVISSRPELLPGGAVKAAGFKQLVLDHLFE